MTEPGYKIRRVDGSRTVKLTVFVEVLAESLLRGVRNSLQHQVQSSRSSADGTHAVVNTTRAKTTLDDL